MTKNISEEELLLRKRARRRLVGAVVLVIFSIIVLPIIFDEPKLENEQHEIAINLPTPNKSNRNDVAPVSKAGVVDRETSDRADSLPDLKAKVKVNVEEVAEVTDGRKHIPIPGIKPKINTPPPVEAKTTANSPMANNAAANVAADTTKGFVVQLGAFSDPSKAKQQHANLASNGFKAYTETLKVDHNEVTRVRVGPFATRNAAESELKKLKKLGLDGVVTPK